MDPEVYGGAPLLGFNGTVIKAHGSARERAMANAIRVAVREIQHRVNQTIARRNCPRQRAFRAYPFTGLRPHSQELAAPCFL